MRISTYLILLTAPLALAACDSGEEAEMPMAAEEMPMAAEDMPMDPESMPMMEAGAEMQTASAEGTVTAIDEVAGTITIDHGPVPAVNWPAMTMPFDANEALVRQVEVGDQVSFDFRTGAAGNEVTSIAPQ